MSGQPKKISSENSKAIGQYIRRNSTISSRKLESKLLLKGMNVSYSTVLRHLASLGYDKKHALAPLCLQELSEERRWLLFGKSKWLKRFLNDNEDNETFDY
ncbi:9481_t:CDS:2, partial [Funneliformis geosporum]